MEQALIVDDSKTARVILRNKLQKLDITVDMVESGEEALAFLKHNNPSMIFMDHMMPGMDGFETVKAIKSNPAKSSIPIVMHTTRKGEVYLGQAKALGAADIFTKPGSDSELLLVLGRLRVLNDTSSQAENVSKAVKPEINSDELLEIIDFDTNENENIHNDQRGNIDNHSQQAAIFPDDNIVNGELDKNPQVVNIAHDSKPESDLDTLLEKPVYWHPDPQPFLGTFRQWLLALIWLTPSLWLLWLYLPVQSQLEQTVLDNNELYNTLEWALNQQESYDYGEIPLGAARLDLLKVLMEKLANANFIGVVRLEGHVGEFCLSQVQLFDGKKIEMLPEFDLPVTECTSIGSSREQAVAMSVAQSSAFKRYLIKAHDLYPTIEIDKVAFGASKPLIAYPEGLEGINAGQWNEIALLNNRVYFQIIPTRFNNPN